MSFPPTFLLFHPSKWSLSSRNIFIFLNWRIVTLQYYVSFYCTVGISYVLSHLSHVQLFANPWTIACQSPLSMEFSHQEYWSELSLFLQRIFPTQGSNLCLLHYEQIPYH